MTIKNITINTILTIALLISHSYTWTMNHNSLVITKKYLKGFYRADTKEDRLQQYITNRNSGILGTLPSETLTKILSAINPLDEKIKTILALHTTCKKFNALTFQYLAETCHQDTDSDKKNLLFTIMRTKIMYSKIDYWKIRTPFLILLLATNKECPSEAAFRHIMHANDIKAIELLNIHPEKAKKHLPLAQTPAMALKLCTINNANLKNTINIDTISSYEFLYQNEKALEMLEFYINNDIPLDTIDTKTGNCLLHIFIDRCYSNENFTNKAIKAIQLIVNAYPVLTNVQNKEKQTPNDLALLHLNTAQRNLTQALLEDSYPKNIYKTHTITFTNVLKILNNSKRDL